jgi:hypothetical protein
VRIPLLVALLLSGLMMAATAFAADPVGRTIPYQKLYEPIAKMRSGDPQGILIARLQARAAEKGKPLPADLKLELRTGGTSQPIAFDHVSGRFELPIRADWASGDTTQIWLNYPKSEVGITLDFSARLPPSANTSYGRLMESLAVVERMVKQQAGIMSFMAPKFEGVELIWPAGTAQTATIGTGATAKTLRSDAQGHLRIPFDSATPANAVVVLSSLPSSLGPYTK